MSVAPTRPILKNSPLAQEPIETGRALNEHEEYAHDAAHDRD